MITKAVLVLVLSTTDTGDIVDYKAVRSFQEEKHCIIFKLHPKFDQDKLDHGFDYWLDNRDYAKPGYTISFHCRAVGPIYTA